MYLGTQKPVPADDDDSDTSAGAEKQSTVVKEQYYPETPDASDEEGFIPVVTRQNRRNKRSHTLSSTPTLERKFPSSPNLHQARNTGISTTRVTLLPTEIRLMEHNGEYSRMDECLHLPVQVDTLTEILQEMTNHVDRRDFRPWRIRCTGWKEKQ